MIDLYLRSRTCREIPEAYRGILDESGGVTRRGFDGREHQLHVRCVYTAEASSECVGWDDQWVVLIDLRFVDFVLDLIAASEVEGDGRPTSIMFAMYVVLLEQTLRYPDSALQRGALLDFVVSRVTADTHFGWSPPRGEHDAGRLEYVAKLVVAHELAHAWIAVDGNYVAQIVGLFDTEIAHLESFSDRHQADAGGRLVFAAAREARQLLASYSATGRLVPALEELLCDYVMVWSGAEAAVATEARRARAFTYMSLASSTLTALWVVPTLQKAVRAVMDGQPMIDLDPSGLRDVRAVLATIVYLRIVGVALNEGDDRGGGKTAAMWAETADFERVCIETLNQLMGAANVQRLALIGACGQQVGMQFDEGVRSALLRLLKWV